MECSDVRRSTAEHNNIRLNGEANLLMNDNNIAQWITASMTLWLETGQKVMDLA